MLINTSINEGKKKYSVTDIFLAHFGCLCINLKVAHQNVQVNVPFNDKDAVSLVSLVLIPFCIFHRLCS